MNKFNTFNDIAHRPLRIYNRAVMYFNLYEDQGRNVAEEYAQSLTKEERLEVAQMTALVKKKGVKVVQALVTKGVDFVDEPFKEESRV